MSDTVIIANPAAAAGRVGREKQALHARIEAVLGPSICGACYEVPDALRREVAAVAPEAFTTTSQGSPGLDLPAGALAQLARLGVHAERLEACTRERADLFSYRRDGLTGRFGGAIVRHTT